MYLEEGIFIQVQGYNVLRWTQTARVTEVMNVDSPSGEVCFCIVPLIT